MKTNWDDIDDLKDIRDKRRKGKLIAYDEMMFAIMNSVIKLDKQYQNHRHYDGVGEITTVPIDSKDREHEAKKHSE